MDSLHYFNPFFNKNCCLERFYINFPSGSHFSLLGATPPGAYSILRDAAGGIPDALTAGKNPATNAAAVIHRGNAASSIHG